MTTSDLIFELRENNIDKGRCLVLPRSPVEGALCLQKMEGGRWRIIFNDRGEFTIDEAFQSEHEACRFFLRTALLDPTNRLNFTPADLQSFEKKRQQLLLKYGFSVEGT